MSKIKWTALVLLLIAALDASGDAFRVNGWQIAHHLMEVAQIGAWLVVWILFRFNPVWIVMYLLGRFVAFDGVYNLIVGNEFFYVGASSLYGRFLEWFTAAVKTPSTMLVSALKFIALVWWVAWFWTDHQLREWKFVSN